MFKALFIVALLAFQATPQRDDTPEEGKPARCDNFKATPEAHRCKCGKAMHTNCAEPDPDVAMDQRCSTYCRRQNCHCLSMCET